MGPTIRFERLTKRYGTVIAVDGLTATVPCGKVTAFLGANGAGKTTTLRLLLGLVRPDAGVATFDGRGYTELDEPARRVGAVVDGFGFHPGRRAIDHLRVIAAAAGLGDEDVERSLAAVSLTDVCGRKVGGFSLGMRQRLGLAASLLGDPDTLVLDEPANGLDPAGVRWLRGFLRSAADEGRTVLLSSHVLAEVQHVADHVLVVAGGRLRWEGPLPDLLARSGVQTTVTAPDATRLAKWLSEAGDRVELTGDDTLVTSAPARAVGELACQAHVVLHRLVESSPTLDDAFAALTGDAG